MTDITLNKMPNEIRELINSYLPLNILTAMSGIDKRSNFLVSLDRRVELLRAGCIHLLQQYLKNTEEYDLVTGTLARKVSSLEKTKKRILVLENRKETILTITHVGLCGGCSACVNCIHSRCGFTGELTTRKRVRYASYMAISFAVAYALLLLYLGLANGTPHRLSAESFTFPLGVFACGMVGFLVSCCRSSHQLIENCQTEINEHTHTIDILVRERKRLHQQFQANNNSERVTSYGSCVM